MLIENNVTVYVCTKNVGIIRERVRRIYYLWLVSREILFRPGAYRLDIISAGLQGSGILHSRYLILSGYGCRSLERLGLALFASLQTLSQQSTPTELASSQILVTCSNHHPPRLDDPYLFQSVKCSRPF